MPLALELHGITKHFGAVRALDDATLAVAAGEVHALLGENGAGKTTLMRIAFGLERADRGVVRIAGQPMPPRSPREAIARGLAMVQQHFSLVPALTVAENLSLGDRGRYRPALAEARARELARSSGLALEPSARAGTLSIGGQQRLEILKATARRARILILDEPTAVLAPREAEDLLRLLRALAADGTAVVLITHKLREALAVADSITVLRRGRTVASLPAAEASADSLARLMFPDAPAAAPGQVSAVSSHGRAAVATLDAVTLHDDSGVVRLRDGTLEVRAGEILGVAGVEGSGYAELLRALAGRLLPSSGRAALPERIGYIPEDRSRDGLVAEFSVAENVALRDAGTARGRIHWRAIGERTKGLLARYAIRAPGPAARTATLSGGNQQKLILARELSAEPALIVAVNPTRGLDPLATRAVLAELAAARDRGVAVVLYTSDLDELLAIADRVIALYAGEMRHVTLDREAIGRAMLGL